MWDDVSSTLSIWNQANSEETKLSLVTLDKKQELKILKESNIIIFTSNVDMKVNVSVHKYSKYIKKYISTVKL